jgi:hypothetical protein
VKKLIIILIAIVSHTYACELAEVVGDKPGWQKFSETSVNFKSDKDVIEVLGADKFQLLMIKVTQGAINLESLEIYYADGTREDIEVKSHLKENEESRVIHLKGSGQEMKKIVFIYHTLDGSSSDQAHLELYGMK